MFEEEVGVDPYTRQGTNRFQDGVTGRCDYSSFIVVSAGLEPTHSEPKSDALPLGYETI